MGSMDIDESVHTRKSFVAVAVASCEWAFNPNCDKMFCSLPRTILNFAETHLIRKVHSFAVTSSQTKSKDFVGKGHFFFLDTHTHDTCIFLRRKGIYQRRIDFFYFYDSLLFQCFGFSMFTNTD